MPLHAGCTDWEILNLQAQRVEGPIELLSPRCRRDLDDFSGWLVHKDRIVLVDRVGCDGRQCDVKAPGDFGVDPRHEWNSMAVAHRSTNWFAVWISITVVIVLIALGGLIVFLNSQATSPGAVPESDFVDSETGAITVGEGADEVAIWFDFYCPHCQDFEAVYGPSIESLLEDGEISLRLQPVALSGLNAASRTEFSERSGSALYCVAETAPEATMPFFQQLFAEKPAGEGLSDDQLSSLAADVGATDAAECIEDGTFREFVVDQAGKLPENPEGGGAGTPTLIVNGEYVPITGNVDADILNRLND